MKRTGKLVNVTERLSRWLAPLALATAASAAPVAGASRMAAGSGHDPAILLLAGASLIVLGCLGRRSKQVSD